VGKEPISALELILCDESLSLSIEAKTDDCRWWNELVNEAPST
jgi:hypothetical protein